MTAPAGAPAVPRPAAPAVDDWTRMLPPPDSIEWFPPGTQLLRADLVLVIAAAVDGFVVLGIAGAYGPLNLPRALLGTWGALLVGPAAGIVVTAGTTPYRLGITPRGLLLRFVYGSLFVPWNFVFPDVQRTRRYRTLAYVDTRTMKVAAVRIRPAQTRLIVGHRWSETWDSRAEAARVWGTAAT